MIGKCRRNVNSDRERWTIAVIEAHLKHLQDHKETAYLQQALAYLSEHGIAVDLGQSTGGQAPAPQTSGGCPGSRTVSFAAKEHGDKPSHADATPSELTHWPIQLHLISPHAPHYRDSDLLLAADCVAFSVGGFHRNHLKGRTLVIACPKLDHGQEVYLDKLATLIGEAGVKSVTVMIMQVPCCSGLLLLARRAMERAGRNIPLHFQVVGLRGEILQEG